MSDLEDYLQEGFDPRAVTMPRLRSILVTHNIDYPSTAKKAQLVELVSDHILPQAPKLRAQRARAKRSSMGIVNAGSAEDDGIWDDSELAAPASVRRSKTPRKSSAKIKSEEEDNMGNTAMRSPAKRSARSVSRALSTTEDSAAYPTEAPKSSRRSRRTITPDIKVEEDVSHGASFPDEEEESIFTDDNPFQSGSSPPVARRTPSGRRLSEIDAADNAKSRRPNTAQSRRSRTPKTFDLSTPVARYQTPDSPLDVGEEFTPNEQLELEHAAQSGEVSIAPRKRQSSRRRGFGTPLSVLLTTLGGAYLAWYRQEKIAVGYCGLGRPANVHIIPAIMENVPTALVPLVEPQCEPCPPHAICYEDFSTRCENDFVLSPHPLSFGGLVPLPPSCVADGEKARRVQAVADKAIEELRDIRAKFECGELVDEEGHTKDTPAVAEEELKSTVSKKRSKRLNNDEFDDLWAAAIGDVTGREEVQVETPRPDASETTGRRLTSTSLARLSLTCATKRSVKLGLARYRLAIGLLAAAMCGFVYLRATYRRHVATSAQVPSLVNAVLERLANQKELGEEDIDDPWLFLPNLRDDVLRSVHALSERERIWRKVRAVVELNSNVRTSQREGRSGEIGRAWEWIGPLASNEGARRRKSGRVSFGPDAVSDSPIPQEMAEARKWEEKRPIY